MAYGAGPGVPCIQTAEIITSGAEYLPEAYSACACVLEARLFYLVHVQGCHEFDCGGVEPFKYLHPEVICTENSCSFRCFL